MDDRPAAETGFTLLETLVALTILGFLMVALVQGIRAGLDFWDRQTRRITATAELDATTRVLRAIFTTIPIRPTTFAASVSLGFKGRSDQIAVVGQLPNGLGSTRLVDMSVRLRAGRVVISWTPHRHDLADTAPVTAATTQLMRGVDRLEFAYWGRASHDLPAAWLGRWDGPALPALIRVRVRFANGDNRRWPDLIAAPQLWSPQG